MIFIFGMILSLYVMTPIWVFPRVIGISGGSGSGKTTFSQMLQEQLGEDSCVVIHQDNYYKSLSDLPVPPDFDHPDAVDFDLLYKHLVLLKNGEAINQPIFDFITHERAAFQETILPKNTIILEGFLIFFAPEIRDSIDVKIFLDVDENILLARQIDRDSKERGKSLSEIQSDYINYIKPAYIQYVLPSKKYADLIIPNNNIINEYAKNMLLRYLKDDS